MDTTDAHRVRHASRVGRINSLQRLNLQVALSKVDNRTRCSSGQWQTSQQVARHTLQAAKQLRSSVALLPCGTTQPSCCLLGQCGVHCTTDGQPLVSWQL